MGVFQMLYVVLFPSSDFTVVVWLAAVQEEEMKKGEGGNPLCSAYCPFSPFPLAQNKFCTVYKDVREKEGWGGRKRRGEQSENGRKPVPSGVIVR